MKRFIVTSVLILATALSVAFTGVAQNNAPAPKAKSSVAVVDVMKILGEWKYVSNRVTDLQTQYKPKIDAIKARDEELKKQAQGLQTLKRGTPDYQQMEDSLLRKGQDIQADLNILNKQFDEQRAKIHQDAYKFIKQFAEYYARTIGASCVIQINSAEEFQIFNPRASAMELTQAEVVARQVVWYDSSINITDMILTKLNSGANGNANGGAAATKPAATTTAPAATTTTPAPQNK